MTGSAGRPFREFGSWLRSRRLARRWTQDELARRLEYDVTYVRKIEWGERRPSDAFRIRLAQVLGVPLSSLPAAVPATPSSRVPGAPDALIGRGTDVDAILALFHEGARLVTVVGPPGIGKTRVAIAVAACLDDQLPGGARFVPLVGISGADLVGRAIGQALGAAPSDDESELERLVDALRGHDIFLVLDNFEHIVDAATLVAELLANVPTLRILVTSRHPLNLRSETQYALPPLPLPERLDDAPERLTDISSVALFLARARNVRPDVTLDGAGAATVAEICVRLQGIPLAIELAAGAVRFLTPKAVLEQLGAGLDLPVAGPSDAPEHHRTLRAAIGWSFELLGPQEHIVMSRLGVFAGGCTMQGAAAVCRLPHEQALDPGRVVLALASKSLLRSVPDGPGGPRFVALESVRAFALERLAAANDLERFQRRHASWFVELADVTERRLTGPDQTEELGVLEAEHANFRAALEWSLAHDSPMATRLCAGLWRFWWIRGHLVEGRRWLAAALALPQPDPAVHALALVGAGVLARTQGAYSEAVDLLSKGETLARAIDDRRTLALSLLNLGNVVQDKGELQRALVLFEESRNLYAAVGDLRGVGHSLNCLGTAHLGQGDLEAAAGLFEVALSIFREQHDDWSIAMVLANLGWVAYKSGRSAVARALYERGIGMYRSLGDDRGVANMLVNLGIATDFPARRDTGAGLFEEALLTFCRLGERRGVAECLEALAVARTSSDPHASAVILGAAKALRESIGAHLTPEEATSLAADVEEIRTRLGADAFDVAWQEGRIMAMDEVVATALTDGKGPASVRL